MIFVSITGKYMTKGAAPIWGIGIGVGIIVLAIMASYIFNKRGQNPDLRSLDQRRKELDDAGVLLRTDFIATEFFEMSEFDDEGMHLFIGLENNKTLYMTGQYLYDYGDCDEDANKWISVFPTEKFTVVENKEAGYVFEIIHEGKLLSKCFDDFDIPKSFFINGKPRYIDMQVIDKNIRDVYNEIRNLG
jgi:hypothetical protein